MKKGEKLKNNFINNSSSNSINKEHRVVTFRILTKIIKTITKPKIKDSKKKINKIQDTNITNIIIMVITNINNGIPKMKKPFNFTKGKWKNSKKNNGKSKRNMINGECKRKNNL